MFLLIINLKHSSVFRLIKYVAADLIAIKTLKQLFYRFAFAVFNHSECTDRVKIVYQLERFTTDAVHLECHGRDI